MFDNTAAAERTTALNSDLVWEKVCSTHFTPFDQQKHMDADSSIIMRNNPMDLFLGKNRSATGNRLGLKDWQSDILWTLLWHC